ncbi:MAG: hypothetical protein ACUVV6_06605 [Thermoplasmatota archaeon]
MKVRIPWSFTALVLLMLIWAGYTAGAWSGLIDPGSDAALLAGFVMGWVGVLVFAILGAFLLGMYVGHRILSMADITPFEEEMLRMRQDCSEMRTELKHIREELAGGEEREERRE